MANPEFDLDIYQEKTSAVFDKTKTVAPGVQRAILHSLASEMYERGEIKEDRSNQSVDYWIYENYVKFPVQEVLQYPLAPEEADQLAQVSQFTEQLFQEDITPDMRLYFLANLLSNIRVAIRQDGFVDEFDILYEVLDIDLNNIPYAF